MVSVTARQCHAAQCPDQHSAVYEKKPFGRFVRPDGWAGPVQCQAFLCLRILELRVHRNREAMVCTSPGRQSGETAPLLALRLSVGLATPLLALRVGVSPSG